MYQGCTRFVKRGRDGHLCHECREYWNHLPVIYPKLKALAKADLKRNGEIRKHIQRTDQDIGDLYATLNRQREYLPFNVPSVLSGRSRREQTRRPGEPDYWFELDRLCTNLNEEIDLLSFEERELHRYNEDYARRLADLQRESDKKYPQWRAEVAKHNAFDYTMYLA